MTTPYCGAKTTPKGKHNGSRQECTDANQIRRYGLKKIDPSTITKTVKVNYEKLLREARLERSGYNGGISRHKREGDVLKQKLENNDKGKHNVSELKKQIKENDEKLKEFQNKYNQKSAEIKELQTKMEAEQKK